MATIGRAPAILVGVTPSTLSREVAALLALQRAEEPETPIRLHEMSAIQSHKALVSHRLDMAIDWARSAKSALNAQPIWRDELALAVPARSPLLFSKVASREVLSQYPLFHCCPCGAYSLEGQPALPDLLGCSPVSFSLMALLVAAGYGVGVAPRSRILLLRGSSIFMRAMAGAPLQVGVDIRPLRDRPTPAVMRIMERAKRVSSPTIKSIPDD